MLSTIVTELLLLFLRNDNGVDTRSLSSFRGVYWDIYRWNAMIWNMFQNNMGAGKWVEGMDETRSVITLIIVETQWWVHADLL